MERARKLSSLAKSAKHVRDLGVPLAIKNLRHEKGKSNKAPNASRAGRGLAASSALAISTDVPESEEVMPRVVTPPQPRDGERRRPIIEEAGDSDAYAFQDLLVAFDTPEESPQEVLDPEEFYAEIQNQKIAKAFSDLNPKVPSPKSKP